MAVVRAGQWKVAGTAGGGILLALVLLPGLARACVLDNTASLWANGVRAAPNLTAPTDLARWAPFSVDKAFASGAPLTLSENRADLVRSLSAATLAAPFRWTFGDGVSALGHTAVHRYVRPGLYTVVVYGMAAQGQWIQFDRVLLRIVSPGETLQANLGYYALRALDLVVPAALWLVEGLVAAVLLYALLVRPRLKRAGQARRATERAPATADEREVTHA